MFKRYWIDYSNNKKNRHKSISKVTYNTEVLPWETNELNFCKICRVELNNSKEDIVILPKCDFIVHKLCIEMYFIKNNEKINCPIFDYKHSFTLKSIENYTENDPRLFDSKNLDNMIELYSVYNVDLKRICTSFRIKKEKIGFTDTGVFKIVNRPKGKVIFHVFDPNYNATYYFICEWSKNGLNIIKKDIDTTKYPWWDIFNNLKRANDNTGKKGWFIFLYNGRKEICAIAEKVLDKDNPEVRGKYKYFLIGC
jgi:hypothetical protein